MGGGLPTGGVRPIVDAANARSALARLMAVRTVDGHLTDAFAPPASIPLLDDWQAQASQHRQDLRAAEHAVESARLSLEAAIRQYFPSITINFNYYLHNDPSIAANWTGGISANIPIFSALAIEADIRRAWSVYRQAGLGQWLVRRQVVDEINQNLSSLKGNRSRITDLEIQVYAARRALELAEKEFEAGKVSNLDRLLQQDNLLIARLELIREQYRSKTNYLGVLRARGALASILQPPG